MIIGNPPSLRAMLLSMLRLVKPARNRERVRTNGFAHARSGVAVLLRCEPEVWPFAREENDMAEVPRLNGMIRCFEEGKPAFGAFCTPDTAAAVAMSDAKYD